MKKEMVSLFLSIWIILAYLWSVEDCLETQVTSLGVESCLLD